MTTAQPNRKHAPAEGFEHVSAPVGRVLAKSLSRAEARIRRNAGRRKKQLHKARRRFWGSYAKWWADPTETNTDAVSGSYTRYRRLAAIESLRD